MIKAIGKGPTGNQTLFIGLSAANLDRFRAQPLDTHILIKGGEVGLPVDVLVFSGHTEAGMAHMLATGIGPATRVHISDKVKH